MFIYNLCILEWIPYKIFISLSYLTLLLSSFFFFFPFFFSFRTHGPTSALNDRYQMQRKNAFPHVFMAPQMLVNCMPPPKDTTQGAGGCLGGDPAEVGPWVNAVPLSSFCFLFFSSSENALMFFSFFFSFSLSSSNFFSFPNTNTTQTQVSPWKWYCSWNMSKLSSKKFI